MTWVFKSLKNFNFNGLLLSKLYIVWAKKVQRSYLSWNWRRIQNLARNRFQIDIRNLPNFDLSTRNLKILHFNGLLLSKVYIAWAKKVQRSYLSWYWGVIQNFKKNWLVIWKMTWGIWQIFTGALESVKIGTLMSSFCPT